MIRERLGKLDGIPVVIGDGNFRMDENRNPHYGGSILVVKNGQFVLAN